MPVNDPRVLAGYRRALEGERTELEARMAELGLGASPGQAKHIPTASQAANWRGEARSAGSSVAERLADVERALAKLDDGTYGTCEACHADIAPARLDALPATRACVNCAARSQS